MEVSIMITLYMYKKIRISMKSCKRKDGKDRNTKTQLTHFTQEQPRHNGGNPWRCHCVEILVLNEENLTFFTLQRQDCV